MVPYWTLFHACGHIYIAKVFANGGWQKWWCTKFPPLLVYGISVHKL